MFAFPVYIPDKKRIIKAISINIFLLVSVILKLLQNYWSVFPQTHNVCQPPFVCYRTRCNRRVYWNYRQNIGDLATFPLLGRYRVFDYPGTSVLRDMLSVDSFCAVLMKILQCISHWIWDTGDENAMRCFWNLFPALKALISCSTF